MKLQLIFVASVLVMIGLPSSISAQSKEQQEKMKEYIVRQNLMMRLMSIQYNNALKEELDIVDDQIEELKAIGRAYNKDLQKFNRDNMQKMMDAQELHQKGEHEKATKLSMDYQTQMFKIADDHYKVVEKKLLPHQIKRLTQISKQENLKHMSSFRDEFGIIYAAADEIGLTSSEKRKLKEAIEKAREKYYSEIVKLKEKAHAEIRKAIPAAKREKADDIVGEIFDQVKTKRTSREAIKKPKK